MPRLGLPPLVFEGKMPYGYLWRLLRRPGNYGLVLVTREVFGWIFTKIEHDRLLATRGALLQQTHFRGTNRSDIPTPAQLKSEAKKVKAQKMLGTTEFEPRARNMGITDNALVAQKADGYMLPN